MSLMRAGGPRSGERPVQDRPTRLDGSDADGIRFLPLTVQESRTPLPRKKSPTVTMSREPRVARVSCHETRENPDASAFYRPSRESRPNSREKKRAGQPTP